MRLFIALDLPQTIKEELGPVLKSLKWGRVARNHQLHLTLYFMGEFPEEKNSAVIEALSMVKAGPLHLRLRGVGCFPTPAKARVLWVGIRPREPLAELKTQIEQALLPLGFPPETRSFRPHITLSRLKKKPLLVEIQTFLTQFQTFSSSDFEVRTFTLYSSTLGREGSRYTRLHDFLLE